MNISEHQEQEKDLVEVPRLKLYFFRHDEKGKNAEGTEAGDYRVSLTDAGRLHAAEVGQTKTDAKTPAIIQGSLRDRSLETALIHAYPELAVHTTLADMRTAMGTLLQEKLNTPLSKARGKIQNWRQTENLNFQFGEPGGPMRQLYDQHFLVEKDLMPYVHEHSDADLLRTKDTSAKSYSIYAGQRSFASNQGSGQHGSS